MASLPPLPADFARNRLAMHRVAAYVVSPARRKVVGRMGLVASPGGFATPPFGPSDEDTQTVVATEGTNLTISQGGAKRMVPITSLNAAASFLDDVPDLEWASQQDIPEPGDLDADLDLTPEPVNVLANWFSLAWDVLLDLSRDAESPDASQPQLWPEHFDPAIEVGSDDTKQRASYGASPGDSAIDEPYMYVAPWYPDDRPESDFWNAPSFPGAYLSYRELSASSDPADAAAAFFRRGRDLLIP